MRAERERRPAGNKDVLPDTNMQFMVELFTSRPTSQPILESLPLTNESESKTFSHSQTFQVKLLTSTTAETETDQKLHLC